MFDISRHNQIILLILISFFIVSGKQSLPAKIPNAKEVPVEHHEIMTPDTVEHIEIVTFEFFPVPVNVIAKGNLPNNCTTIDDITQEQDDNTLTVKIITAHQTDKVCAKEKKSFEEIIPLNVEGLLAGIYTVKVNSVTDSFELGIDNIIH